MNYGIEIDNKNIQDFSNGKLRLGGYVFVHFDGARSATATLKYQIMRNYAFIHHNLNSLGSHMLGSNDKDTLVNIYYIIEGGGKTIRFSLDKISDKYIKVRAILKQNSMYLSLYGILVEYD